MFGFLSPRYIKDGRETLKAARKMLHYKRDLLAADDLATLEAGYASLADAVHRRDREAVASRSEELEKLFGRHFPKPPQAGLRENCEVFFVAIVIAVGVRSYFLQPFTIPTGSMQPTLNGIIAHKTDQPAPGAATRLAHKLLFGRNYVDLVSATDDTIVSLTPVTRFVFFDSTIVKGQRQTFTAPTTPDKLRELGVHEGRKVAAGEVIARGHVDTGDHVFVDKTRYHFAAPQRGDVFVFNTQNLPTSGRMPLPGEPSQFYIKRLAGLPGDDLRIDPPRLFVNGEVASGPGFARVMSEKDGYRGYSNGQDNGYRFPHLGSPDQTLRVPPHNYFALGDNSYNSSDSRNWGPVPERNLVGRALFVYWPFNSHWGLIR